jgi:hypothetical protein
MGIYRYQNYFTDIAVYESSCDYEWMHQTHTLKNLYSRDTQLAIFTEVLYGSSQSLQANAGFIHQLGHNHFQILSN